MVEQLTVSGLLHRLDEYFPKPTDYFRHRANRITQTIKKGEGKVLELGCDSHFSLAVTLFTNYEVLPQNSPTPLAAPEDMTDPLVVFSGPDRAPRRFTRVAFDVERDCFPFEDGSFEGVLCCELIEHLFLDPSWMLAETNRVLRPGGWLFLTTPNLSSYHAIRRAVQGIHPMEHSFYFRQDKYKGAMIQHTREYTFYEIIYLLKSAGFVAEGQWTFTFTAGERLSLFDYVVLIPAISLYNICKIRHPRHLLPCYRKPHTFVLARKAGVPLVRFPKVIYYQ